MAALVLEEEAGDVQQSKTTEEAMARLVKWQEFLSNHPIAGNLTVTGKRTYIAKAISEGGDAPVILVFGRTLAGVTQTHLDVDDSLHRSVDYVTTTDVIETMPVPTWRQDEARDEIAGVLGVHPESITFLQLKRAAA